MPAIHTMRNEEESGEDSSSSHQSTAFTSNRRQLALFLTILTVFVISIGSTLYSTSLLVDSDEWHNSRHHEIHIIDTVSDEEIKRTLDDIEGTITTLPTTSTTITPNTNDNTYATSSKQEKRQDHSLVQNDAEAIPTAEKMPTPAPIHPTLSPSASVDKDRISNNSNNKQHDRKPLNVLLLYGDDWRYDTLGAAGHPVVKTPVLDQLAREGVHFTHNCVTTSVCWCSRANLYTGMYTTRHKTFRPIQWFLPWNVTIYDILKQAGYYVGHAGKWGINHPYKDGYIDFSVEEDGWHMETRGDGTEIHITEKNENDALHFLRSRDQSKPFFLNVAFYATHAIDSNKTYPYTPQRTSHEWYANDTVPLGVTATQDSYMKLNHTIFSEWNEGRIRWNWRYSTSSDYQRNMKDMYRMVTEVDRTCGVLIKELKKQGVYDDTLIIFTTDNGNMHSEHLLAEKWFPQQESIRVPLIIKDPRMNINKIGSTHDAFTLNIDLPSTILGAAGITPPSTMMGRDISELYVSENKDLQWRTEFFYEHPVHVSKYNIPASEALVRKDFKYFYWPDWEFEQLFDLTLDPVEDNDVARSDDPKYIAKLAEMRNRFLELKAIVHDENKIVTL